jgi:hypothetical protein
MSARTLIVDSGGTTRQVKRWFAIDSGSIARFARRVFVIDSGSIARLIFAEQVMASISPSNANATGTGTLTTNSVTCSATGGIPAYTFAWSFQSGGVGITINSPSSATTTFTGFVTSPHVLSGTAQCLATDSIGVVSNAATCSVVISS